MKKLLFAVLIASFLSAPAHALFEIRGGYGIYTPEGDIGPATSIGTVKGFNLDALVEIPLFPLGLGLRYEAMDFAISGLGAAQIESDFTRLSVIANYRFIDFFFYLGAIGTVGFVNDAKLTQSGVTLDLSNDMTFTAGAEGGISLGLFQVGLELGYMIGGDYTIDTAGGTLPAALNLDGIYGKFLVGVGF